MRKRRKFTELRKKYCIRQVFRKKNHVQNLTVIGEEKKSGKNDKNSADLGYHLLQILAWEP